jgi:DNA replication protein DnaC
MAETQLPNKIWATPGVAAAEGSKLILTGPAGSGKTTLLKKVVWGLALRRRKPRGGYIPDMLDKFKSGDVGSYMAWLNGGDLLVLDDLDKLRGTHYEGERILAAINYYDTRNYPVVVTMNVELDAFGDRIRAGGVPADYAEAILSRLRNRSFSYFVSGPDHRRPVS